MELPAVSFVADGGQRRAWKLGLQFPLFTLYHEASKAGAQVGSLCPKGICDTSQVRTRPLSSPVPSHSLEQCTFLATRETQGPSTGSCVLVWKIQTESEKRKRSPAEGGSPVSALLRLCVYEPEACLPQWLAQSREGHMTGTDLQWHLCDRDTLNR